jgi:hypothetical protein
MIRRSLLQSVGALAGSLSARARGRQETLSYNAIFDGLRDGLQELRAVLTDNGYGPEERNLIRASWTPISVKADGRDKSIRHVTVPLRLTYKLHRNQKGS